MITHLYLDDIRYPPEGWTLVKTYSACIELLRTHEVHYLSLDHDLGEGEIIGMPDIFQFYDGLCTGYDVCKWMVENSVWPTQAITLHTANPVGRNNMRQLLERYKPDHVRLYG